MIYTITLNPALDRSITVEMLVSDDANRVVSEERYAGGKGIDVSRVIQVLGGDSVALGFVGGFHGMELEQRLLRQGVKCDFVETRRETRTNILIHEKLKKTHTILNASGPEVNEVEIRELMEKIKVIEDPEYAVISGSIPGGLKVDIYKDIVSIFNKRGSITALDADGEAMKQGIRAVPHIVKPNIHELGRLLGREIKNSEDAIRGAEELLDMGIKIVLISMGGDGAILVSEETKAKGIRALKGIPPEITVDSTVGAGDSFLAAFVLGRKRNLDIKECLALAVASGAAASITPGTELCKREDVERLLDRVKIEEI
ncbi:MAG: 1-phosphofructokinase [Deltaproteobacteria bacterium]|uniref:1-phosphofructokinase n=1 Tax=Candidatus Zymogenus saltonus TaxID=2844893 RepID=A0A9D8KFM8_9DELT|nr:1-phosphofructokinase [Candidatus Zymogenus saltonus]